MGVFLEAAQRRAPTRVSTFPGALSMPRAPWPLRTTLALIVAAASARLDPPPPPGHPPTVDPSPPETRNDDEPQPWSHAHAAAHAALCATTGEGLDAPCRSSLSPPPPPPPPNATAPPAFIYDQLLTANLVLSQTSLVRRGEVLSKAGLVNELNLTRPDPRPGAPILVLNANATNVIVQAASGIVQLQGLASTFLAFTPEWAAAQAAFAAAADEDGAELAEEEDEAQAGIVRRRRRLMREKSAPERGKTSTGWFPSPSPSPSPGTTVRSLLETEGGLDFDDAASRFMDAPAPDDLTLTHPSLVEYVQSVLDGVKDGSIDESTVDAAFEMRRGAKTPSEVRALAGEGFWSALADGLPEDAFDALAASLVGAEAFAAASRENETSSDVHEGSGSGSGSGPGSDSVPGSDSRTSDAKRRARVESILAQLSDVEPKFDFEVSVIARPIVSTLFRGWAARSWTHAALRLAPEEITPYAYADPLALAAADLYPEVAAAYVRSLRAAGTSDEDIRRRLRDAINVRFVVTVIVVARKQISVGGGDILRNIFTLTL